MPDTPITESAARASLDSGAISDATRAEFTRIMAAKGLDPSATLAKHGAAPEVPPAPEPRPAMQPDLDHAKLPRLTSKELKIAADTLSKNWTGDPAVLDAALRNAGLDLVDDGADGRTEIERDFDRTLGAPDGDYDLPDLFVNRANMSAEDRVEIAGEMQNAFREMSIPKHMAQALGRSILDSAETGYQTLPDDVARQRYSAEQKAMTCRVLNVPWSEFVATVKPLVAKLGPEGRELLVASGAVENANVQVWLFRAAELGLLRAGLKANRG